MEIFTNNHGSNLKLKISKKNFPSYNNIIVQDVMNHGQHLKVNA